MIAIISAAFLSAPFIALTIGIIIDEIGFHLYWRKEMRRVLSDPYGMLQPTTTKEN